MVQLSRSILSSLSSLQSSSLLPPELALALLAALQSYQRAASSTSAPQRAEWERLHGVLLNIQGTLKGDEERARFSALLKEAEGEMKGLSLPPSLSSTGSSSSGATNQIQIKTNGLLPPSPPSRPHATSPPTPMPSSSESTAPSPLPSSVLPLLLSSLAPTSSFSSSSSPPTSTSLSSVPLLTTLSLAPALVLPPGKTLASLLARPSNEEEERERNRKRKRMSGDLGDDSGVPLSLEERVGGMMRKAFWDEALQKLESPPPSSSVRLALLQTDLTTALQGLVPADKLAGLFPVPDQETGWDPAQFIATLTNLLNLIKGRCAPVRDEEVDGLLRSLDTIETDATSSPASSKERTRSTLFVVEGILSLAETMKADLRSFNLLSLPPTSLPPLLRSLSQTHERQTILAHFPRPTLASSLSIFVGSASLPSTLPTLVCSSIPIGPERCSSAATSDPNALPPLLLGSTPLLFHLQNKIQALVITASLLALMPSSPSTEDLPSRIHSLLTADLHALSTEAHVNISDLTSILLSTSPASSTEHEQLRGKVARVLRAEDPVWKLLLSRLETALPLAISPSVSPVVEMRTGRETISGAGAEKTSDRRRVKIKGFEGLVLEEGAGEVAQGLQEVMGWLGEVWGDVLKDTGGAPARQASASAA